MPFPLARHLGPFSLPSGQSSFSPGPRICPHSQPLSQPLGQPACRLLREAVPCPHQPSSFTLYLVYVHTLESFHVFVHLLVLLLFILLGKCCEERQWRFYHCTPVLSRELSAWFTCSESLLNDWPQLLRSVRFWGAGKKGGGRGGLSVGGDPGKGCQI